MKRKPREPGQHYWLDLPTREPLSFCQANFASAPLPHTPDPTSPPLLLSDFFCFWGRAVVTRFSGWEPTELLPWSLGSSWCHVLQREPFPSWNSCLLSAHSTMRLLHCSCSGTVQEEGKSRAACNADCLPASWQGWGGETGCSLRSLPSQTTLGFCDPVMVLYLHVSCTLQSAEPSSFSTPVIFKANYACQDCEIQFSNTIVFYFSTG